MGCALEKKADARGHTASCEDGRWDPGSPQCIVASHLERETCAVNLIGFDRHVRHTEYGIVAVKWDTSHDVMPA